jgi:FAD:protein FMN transferase
VRGVLLLLTALLFGCQNMQNPTIFSGTAMTIDYKILIGQSISQHEKIKISTIINETFNEVDSIYNKWNPHSELAKLNDLKANIHVPLSSQMENFLKLTQSIVTLSEGRFDPTIEPIQQLWKHSLEKGYAATDIGIAMLLPSIGWDKIHIVNGFFSKDHDQTRLDLGGIAKGYCVDLLVERLNAVGYPHVFVEWGGEIRASGKHPDQRPWTVFISHLGDTNPENAIAIIPLNNSAIATSGDYLQNWTLQLEAQEKITYFHIFNPKTGMPLIANNKSIASASILAQSCAFADGIATAAMMFPTLSKAEEWLDSLKAKYPQITYWLISREETSDIRLTGNP